MWRGDSTSPPVRTVRSGLRSASRVSTRRWNSAEVKNATVAPWRAIVAPMSASAGCGSATMATLPPFRSAPQISNVEASKASGERWRNTSSGAKRT